MYTIIGEYDIKLIHCPFVIIMCTNVETNLASSLIDDIYLNLYIYYTCKAVSEKHNTYRCFLIAC